MEKSILSCEELHSFLRSCGFVYLTGYGVEIDPIQYFVFVMTGKDKRRLEAFVDGRRLEGRYSAGRVIKVVQLGRIISRKWRQDILSRSAVNADGVRVIAHEDFMLLGLVYIFTQYMSESYVFRNILENYGLNDIDSMSQFLFSRMKTSGYKIKVFGYKQHLRTIFKYNKRYNMLSLWDIACMSLCYLRNRIHLSQRIRIVQHNENLSAKSKDEHSKTIQEFVKFVDEKLCLSGIYEVLPIDNDLYGCTFIMTGGMFIKGNENTSLTNSFRNEVNAQKKLLTLSAKDREAFICMESFCDEEKQFIVYPFVHGITLSEYCCKNGPLSTSELETLGRFLVNALDSLYKAGIVHRDLGSRNIMYCLNEQDKFMLFDFGCAYTGEPDIFSDNEYFDEHIRTIVCGNLRYDKNIWDDAASAYYTYLLCGGNPDDHFAVKIKSLIGRSYKA